MNALDSLPLDLGRLPLDYVQAMMPIPCGEWTKMGPFTTLAIHRLIVATRPRKTSTINGRCACALCQRIDRANARLALAGSR